MEGNLVIVESPAKARTIQKFLGDGFVVKSSFGHIRDLQDKKLSIDLNDGFKPEYVVSDDKKKTVAELKKAAKSAEIVWLASDEDREGEAISWHLVETLGIDPSKTRRIVFHEITKTAIEEAISNPRSIDMNLVNAQQARRVLDRLVGFELSPVLWRKVKRGLSAGRVQSVALRLVVDREREINAFKSEPYYRVQACFHPQGTEAGTSLKARLDSRIGSIDEARALLEDAMAAKFTVEKVDSNEGTRHPAPPFTTSTLQQEASRKLHMSVSNTMRVAQELYERGLITYMRTDSTNLSNLALGTAKEFICSNYGSDYSHTRQFKTTSKGAQEAHEAIRPTFIANTEIEGSPQEKKLYNLIWKRTVASQMEDARVLNTSVQIGMDNRKDKFSAQAASILFDGFLKLYAEGNDDEGEDSETALLPETVAGQVMERMSMSAECKFTQAPASFSEATLVKKLEELGIGRPSTYAPTISTLISREYIYKGDRKGSECEVLNLILKGDTIKEERKIEVFGNERGKLLPQDSGSQVSDYLCKYFSEIMDYEFTANVEKEFDDIAAGEIAWNEYISRFYGPFHGKVDEALKERVSSESREIGTDPADGQMIVLKRGQYGPYVQKGEGDNRQFASLAKGQLFETLTLEEAVKLFQLPRTAGEYKGEPVVVLKGRFGPYIKYAGNNFSLPKGSDPLSIGIDKCIEVIESADSKPANDIIAEFGDADIQIINGRYGPYIKHAGNNYKIPKGCDAGTLDEAACRELINNSQPTSKRGRRSSGSKQ